MQHSELLPALIEAAYAAGDEIMIIYKKMLEQGELSSDTKADGSPVTQADQAAEAVILPRLQQLCPDITVISEENAASHGIEAPKQFFLVDPLDGTKEFLKCDGKGSFTVNIALIEQGTPVLGVVYAPVLKRMFYASSDGAFEQSRETTRAIKVREVPSSGAVAVASVSHRDADTDQWLKTQGIDQTTSIGSSLKFCLVAAGEADVYPRFGPTMEWDTAAGDAVLRAAGGRVVDPQGIHYPYGKRDYRNGAFIALGQFSMQ